MIKQLQPDVVGLVEATNPRVVEELAQRLGYAICDECVSQSTHKLASGSFKSPADHRIKNAHFNPETLTKGQCWKYVVEEPDGMQFTVFVTASAAAFSQGWAGDAIRRREVREILRIMGEARNATSDYGRFQFASPWRPVQGQCVVTLYCQADIRYQKNPHAMVGHPHLEFRGTARHCAS